MAEAKRIPGVVNPPPDKIQLTLSIEQAEILCLLTGNFYHNDLTSPVYEALCEVLPLYSLSFDETVEVDGYTSFRLKQKKAT